MKDSTLSAQTRTIRLKRKERPGTLLDMRIGADAFCDSDGSGCNLTSFPRYVTIAASQIPQSKHLPSKKRVEESTHIFIFLISSNTLEMYPS